MLYIKFVKIRVVQLKKILALKLIKIKYNLIHHLNIKNKKINLIMTINKICQHILTKIQQIRILMNN